MKKMSLKLKLIIAFILVITIPIVTLSIMVYNTTTASYEDMLTSSSSEQSELIKQNIQNYMNIYSRATSLLSNDANVKTARTVTQNRSWVYKAFESFIDEYQEVKNVYVGYSDRTFLIYPETELPADYDPTTRPWYTDAVAKNELIWTAPYNDASDASIVVVSAGAPVTGISGNIEGVLALDLDITEIAKMANDVQIGKYGYIFLVGPDSVPFTHPDVSIIGQPISVDGLRTFVESNTEGRYAYTIDGIDRIAIMTSMERLGWKIIAVVDEREIQEDTNKLLWTIVAIASVLLILAIIGAIIFSNRIIKNVRNMSDTVSVVSKGDFTKRIKIKTHDEIGKLGADLNVMIDSVSALLKNVNHATDDVLGSATSLVDLSDRSRSASKEVAYAVEEVAQGATKQAQDSEVSSRIAYEMGDNIKKLTDNILEMIHMTKTAGDVNAESVKSVEVLRAKNEENNEATLKTETAILELEKQSQDIGSIVGAISTIAEQTNLLALNASIEAARAGEHGRGFAVVADEIRKLAEESSKAADEIKNIVVNIQSGSQNTVNIMQEVKSRSSEQNEAVVKVEDAFTEIFNVINSIQGIIDTISNDIEVLDDSKIQILDSISSIASISEEAAAASEEVSASMQEQTAIVEEVASSADQLKDLALGLENNIKKFKI
ncbi:methyl-accepting chemotaxis protein [Fusibacter tunisiensis]|uniref:Methyl-accepting chemotaxis protein n=1 Tax=Fusibacter tunisiensis TaxID=1008308 RepID=A0ABS2MMU2_9FIRM|nr:methyl-accepting chemotaxis protein [Fusibacter tunisiensis]MBM7560703.1 methyl-accepting chemotaxis protein [Fusibacter tunisiensis]